MTGHIINYIPLIYINLQEIISRLYKYSLKVLWTALSASNLAILAFSSLISSDIATSFSRELEYRRQLLLQPLRKKKK